jgi:hypothetical protein
MTPSMTINLDDAFDDDGLHDGALALLGVGASSGNSLTLVVTGLWLSLAQQDHYPVYFHLFSLSSSAGLLGVYFHLLPLPSSSVTLSLLTTRTSSRQRSPEQRRSAGYGPWRAWWPPTLATSDSPAEG